MNSKTNLTPRPLLVGISGGSCSGKSTLAESLLEAFGKGAGLIRQDHYYNDLSHLSLQERHEVNFDAPSSIEFSLFAKHLHELKNGKAIVQPNYDFAEHRRTAETNPISPPAQLLIIEGTLLYSMPEVSEEIDLKVFVDASEDVRVQRRVNRDVSSRGRDKDSVLHQLSQSVLPMHNLYIEPCKQQADLVLAGESPLKELVSAVLTQVYTLTPTARATRLPSSAADTIPPA